MVSGARGQDLLILNNDKQLSLNEKNVHMMDAIALFAYLKIAKCICLHTYKRVSIISFWS